MSQNFKEREAYFSFYKYNMRRYKYIVFYSFYFVKNHKKGYFYLNEIWILMVLPDELFFFTNFRCARGPWHNSTSSVRTCWMPGTIICAVIVPPNNRSSITTLTTISNLVQNFWCQIQQMVPGHQSNTSINCRNHRWAKILYW